MKTRVSLCHFAIIAALLTLLVAYFSPVPYAQAQQEDPPTSEEAGQPDGVGSGQAAPRLTKFFYLPLIRSSGCRYTLSPGSVSFDAASVPAGSTICLKGGTYSQISIRNAVGTQNNPIIIRNTGGRVHMTGDNWVELRGCEHVRFTGTGTPGVEYGFYVTDIFLVYGRSHHVEIDHIEMSGARMRVYEVDDKDFVMTDVHIHNNYFHDYGSTAIYVGHANYDLHPGDYEMKRAEINDNLIENMDGQGIKVASVVEECRVHDNVIRNVVRAPGGLQEAAIKIGQGVDSEIYNNLVNGSGGWGIVGVDEFFTHKIYNNLLINTGHGNYEDAFITWHGNYSLYQNTIIGADGHGLNFAGRSMDANYAFNNVILDTRDAPINQDASPSDNFHHNHTKYDGYTSLNYGFVDPSHDDFHPGRDYRGLDVGANSGIVIDLDGTPRPLGRGYDLGCYEGDPDQLTSRR